MWANDYIGIPFEVEGRGRAGADCWGLVCLIYREMLGIELPTYAGIHAASNGDWGIIATAMEEHAKKWNRVGDPKEFDVILMRRGQLPCHVGVCLGNGQMLHVTEGIDSSIEPFKTMRWEKRIVGYFRHV